MTGMARAQNLAIAVLTLTLSACGALEPFTAPPAQTPVVLQSGVTRFDLRFPCGAVKCAAWLYVPANAAKPPVVVMGHGFAGTRDAALEQFAEHFAKAGIAAFVFDYRNFGASGGAPRQLVDPWAQLDDWRDALGHVRADARVDDARVALWGTSLGGGLALVAAARDGKARAVVAQVPHIDANAEGEATFFGWWWAIRLLFTGWGDLANQALGGAPITIPAIAPSGRFAMIPDDKASVAAKALAVPGSTYRNEVVAHSVFTFDDYNPAVQAAAIEAPVLVIATRADRFAPFGAAEAFAKVHRNVTLKEINGDHFDVYAPPRAEQAANLAVQFLKVHLEK